MLHSLQHKPVYFNLFAFQIKFISFIDSDQNISKCHHSSLITMNIYILMSLMNVSVSDLLLVNWSCKYFLYILHNVENKCTAFGIFLYEIVMSYFE